MSNQDRVAHDEIWFTDSRHHSNLDLTLIICIIKPLDKAVEA